MRAPKEYERMLGAWRHVNMCTHGARFTNKPILSHVGLVAGTPAPTCFHCCPLGCAVLHTVLSAHPAI